VDLGVTRGYKYSATYEGKVPLGSVRCGSHNINGRITYVFVLGMDDDCAVGCLIRR